MKPDKTSGDERRDVLMGQLEGRIAVVAGVEGASEGRSALSLRRRGRILLWMFDCVIRNPYS
jgi:hypothetical protein